MEPYHYPDDGPIAFRRERDLGDVIRVSIEWMRETARVWIPAIALIAGPLYLISAVLGAFVDPESGAVGLVGLIEGIAGLLASAAGFAVLRLYRVGEVDVSVGTVWEEAKSWVGPLFAFGLVTVLLAVVALIPFVIVGAVLGVENSPGLLVVFGLLLLVLFVVVAPHYALGIVSRVFDEDGTIDAYKRASGLIAAHRGLATGTILVVFGMVYFIVFILAGSLEAAMWALGDAPVARSVASVLTTVAIVPAALFGSVGSTFLFESLVERQEGTLLDDEIEAIRADAPEPAARPVPPPAVPEPEAPDTRSFAERQLDARERGADRTDGAASENAGDDGLPRGGFRGGGFDAPA